MAEPSHQSGETTSVYRGMVWTLRLATILFLLPPLALVMLRVLAPQLGLPYLTSMVSLLLYGAVLWGLRSTPPRRFALGLAIALGALWFVLFAAGAIEGRMALHGHAPLEQSSAEIFLAGLVCALALLQAAYTGVAFKLRRSVAGGRGGLPTLIGTIWLGLVWGVSALAIIAFQRVEPGQSPAVGALRTLNTAEITYASTYGDSYSPNLAELASPDSGMPPSAKAAGVIDSALASGTRRYLTYKTLADITDVVSFKLGRGTRFAYRFDYKPGPPDGHGRIKSYTLCARPVDRGVNSNSYFTDETGVIRTTDEDRCPTAKDFAVAG